MLVTGGSSSHSSVAVWQALRLGTGIASGLIVLLCGIIIPTLGLQVRSKLSKRSLLVITVDSCVLTVRGVCKVRNATSTAMGYVSLPA